MPDDEIDFRISVVFEKSATSPTGDYVGGWASVSIDKDGKQVVDDQEDRVSTAELQKAAHNFLMDSRIAKTEHQGEQTGELVESVIVDDDFAKAMGITSPKRGWWTKFHITDPVTKARAAAGEFKGLSMGGRGKRVTKTVQ